MKRALLLLMVTGSLAIVSAQGYDKRDNDRKERKPMVSMEKMFEDEEVISITGKLILENGEQAQLSYKGTTYTIKAPWYTLSELDLEDGQTVTLAGYERVAQYQWDEKEKVLITTSITVDGIVTEMDYKSMGGGRGSNRTKKEGREK